MSGIVCAVCYEDVKPGCEDLQAVAGCGHVFHELCFQQWLEYCHRRPSCPVCKGTCTKNDVHRLYFLSSADLTQKIPSKGCLQDVSGQNVELFQAKVQRLEAQLTIANLGLEAHKQQLKELDEQLLNHRIRLEKSESAQRGAIREREYCKEALFKAQEELKKCSSERSQLLEKNTSLAKELASLKLVADVNLSEDEALRLATVGQGKNKDDIIETLAKSLVIRNKTYKDLVTKYSALGMSENSALRKSDRTSEQLKRAKLRLQELERALELKANKDLRSLKQRPEQVDLKEVTCETLSRVHARVSPRTKSNKASNQFLGVGVKSVSRLEQESRSLASYKDDAEGSYMEHSIGPSKRNTGAEEQVGFGSSRSKAPMESPLRQEAGTSLPVHSGDLTTRPAAEGVAPAWSTQTDNQTTRKRVYATTVGQGCSAFQQGARGFQHITSTSDKGSFILTGADGRGGRVTVLRPPQPLGIRTSTCSPALGKVKRCKPTPARGNKCSELGALHIEHFFGRVE